MAGSVILTAAVHISSELKTAGNASDLPLALHLLIGTPHLLTRSKKQVLARCLQCCTLAALCWALGSDLPFR